MNEQEKIRCAENHRDIALSGQQSAEKRGSELADEFTRLEVQIAAILFVFAGFFEKFTNNAVLSPIVLFVLKCFFALSLILLITSLALGLLHIKRKEKFWDEISNQRFVRHKKWSEAVKGRVTYEEAEAFHTGTGLERGNMLRSPLWTWAIQTTCLAVAVVLLFTLFLVYIFS